MTQLQECDVHLNRKSAPTVSHHGENKLGLFLHYHCCTKYLLPLCNFLPFTQKARGQTGAIFKWVFKNPFNSLAQNYTVQPGSPPKSQHSLCDNPTPTLCVPSQACATTVCPLPSTHPATVPPCVCTHPAPILQHGRWENTSGHLGHVIVHYDAKFLQVRVRAPDHTVTFDLAEQERTSEL